MFQKITFKSYLYNTYSKSLNNLHFVDNVKANVIFDLLLIKIYFFRSKNIGIKISINAFPFVIFRCKIRINVSEVKKPNRSILVRLIGEKLIKKLTK